MMQSPLRFFPGRILSASVLLLGLFSLQAISEVLVEEQFADGNRSRQHPPESLEWFSSVKSGLEEEGGKMAIRGATDSARHAVAYFTKANAPLELQAGQALVLSFDFSPLEKGDFSNNALRFGLFDSTAAERFQNDGDNPEPYDAPGYVCAVGLRGDAHSQIVLFKRSGDGGRLLTNSYVYLPLRSQDASLTLSPGQTYSCTLRVARIGAGQVKLSGKISGGDLAAPLDLTETDATDVITRFDTVGLSIFHAIPDAEFSKIKLSLEKK